MARETASKMIAPGDIESTIGTAQRRNLYTFILPQPDPSAVGTEFRPTCAAKRKHRCAAFDVAYPVGRPEHQGVAVPTKPTMAHEEQHAALSQLVQPRSQQRRGLHASGKDASGTTDEG